MQALAMRRTLLDYPQPKGVRSQAAPLSGRGMEKRCEYRSAATAGFFSAPASCRKGGYGDIRQPWPYDTTAFNSALFWKQIMPESLPNTHNDANRPPYGLQSPAWPPTIPVIIGQPSCFRHFMFI